MHTTVMLNPLCVFGWIHFVFICVQMADLALYTLPEHWPNAVASIIETMKKASLQIVST